MSKDVFLAGVFSSFSQPFARDMVVSEEALVIFLPNK